MKTEIDILSDREVEIWDYAESQVEAGSSIVEVIDTSVIFCNESNLTWLSEKTLEISFDSKLRAFKKADEIDGVKIVYKVR